MKGNNPGIAAPSPEAARGDPSGLLPGCGLPPTPVEGIQEAADPRCALRDLLSLPLPFSSTKNQ